MNRAELFRQFPRPWRLCEDAPGVVLCADGREALTVDSAGRCDNDDAEAMAELIVDLVNGAEQ